MYTQRLLGPDLNKLLGLLAADKLLGNQIPTMVYVVVGIKAGGHFQELHRSSWV